MTLDTMQSSLNPAPIPDEDERAWHALHRQYGPNAGVALVAMLTRNLCRCLDDFDRLCFFTTTDPTMGGLLRLASGTDRDMRRRADVLSAYAAVLRERANTARELSDEELHAALFKALPAEIRAALGAHCCIGDATGVPPEATADAVAELMESE